MTPKTDPNPIDLFVLDDTGHYTSVITEEAHWTTHYPASHVRASDGSSCWIPPYNGDETEWFARLRKQLLDYLDCYHYMSIVLYSSRADDRPVQVHTSKFARDEAPWQPRLDPRLGTGEFTPGSSSRPLEEQGTKILGGGQGAYDPATAVEMGKDPVSDAAKFNEVAAPPKVEEMEVDDDGSGATY